MSVLTDIQEKALRCYIGDVSGNMPFFTDEKAYVTLNSLFFPEILSESARASEGKRLNTEIISDIPRLTSFFEGLFSAFGKACIRENTQTYRVERTSDFQLCRRLGRTVSMTSSSLAGFLDYYRDRRGITLMKFFIPQGSHCINVAETLGFYAKPEEAEILIPPFMSLEISESPLSDKEKNITDCDGAPPENSVNANVGEIAECSEYHDIKVGECSSAIRVYKAFNEGKIPAISDILEYSEWKKTFQKKLHYMLKSCMK